MYIPTQELIVINENVYQQLPTAEVAWKENFLKLFCGF